MRDAATHRNLNLVFTDPATASCALACETIRAGENLFVTYPGYSDYRHIPVIGLGPFQLHPGLARH